MLIAVPYRRPRRTIRVPPIPPTYALTDRATGTVYYLKVNPTAPATLYLAASSELSALDAKTAVVYPAHNEPVITGTKQTFVPFGSEVVTIDAVGTEAKAAAATSVSYTGLTVGSGTHRALVVGIVFSNSSVSGINITWDGTPMTLIGSKALAVSQGVIYFYGLIAPTSGNKTLAVSWTGSSDYYVNAISFTGVNQTGGTTSFAGFASATGTGGSPISESITSAGDDIAIGGIVLDNSGTLQASNNTTWLKDSTETVAGGLDYALGTATVIDTWTFTSGTTNWAWCGFDVVRVTGTLVPGVVLNKLQRLYVNNGTLAVEDVKPNGVNSQPLLIKALNNDLQWWLVGIADGAVTLTSEPSS